MFKMGGRSQVPTEVYCMSYPPTSIRQSLDAHGRAFVQTPGGSEASGGQTATALGHTCSAAAEPDGAEDGQLGGNAASPSTGASPVASTKLEKSNAKLTNLL